MSISESGALTAGDYDRLAWEYYKTLPLGHCRSFRPPIA
jgi:hypothetical protein